MLAFFCLFVLITRSPGIWKLIRSGAGTPEIRAINVALVAVACFGIGIQVGHGITP